jgi:hypothetical protein
VCCCHQIHGVGGIRTTPCRLACWTYTVQSMRPQNEHGNYTVELVRQRLIISHGFQPSDLSKSHGQSTYGDQAIFCNPKAHAGFINKTPSRSLLTDRSTAVCGEAPFRDGMRGWGTEQLEAGWSLVRTLP